MSELKDRMKVNGTATRPAITGWVDKSEFNVSVTSPVAGRFQRTTSMKGKFERDKGVTVITGYVSTGAPRQTQIVIFIGLLLVGLAIIALGMFIQGVIVMAIGAGLYIPLQGDHQNSDYLIKQIRSVLKAKSRDPR